MSTKKLNITPDPNILIVLANTPLKPIDSLCELIDNALDSFDAAKREGILIENRWVRIFIPSPAQIQRFDGVIRVVDNGIGLDEEDLRGALQAGFSTKNKFSTLGLFGVGFNIATAKLGQKTVVTTAKADARGNIGLKALRATIDLPELKRRGDFNVDLEEVAATERGTVVEVANWWPTGAANDRFALELARIPKARLVEQLGRRYSTILRDPHFKVNMTVNDVTVVPFEHCEWSELRTVRRHGGEIPAKIFFDETLANVRRCELDGNVLRPGESTCDACGGSKIIQLRETVRGWIGVQRFDDTSNFGIDIIRNGRAIRVAEKDAFFNYVNELGENQKEYPLDQLTGRIIGEVHLDHVPVDYTKQDFERPSREWQDALKFLRGGGLQQKNRDDGVANNSPLGRIFNGFRRVKKFGKEDMYMGTWGDTKAERISRETELDYYKRFKLREPGYYEDAKWWDLVENATIPLVSALVNCPSCAAQNPDGAYTCVGCGEILRSKECRDCGMKIAQNAINCPVCGVNQVPIITAPWRCEACEHTNSPSDQACTRCGHQKGTPNPLSHDSLLGVGKKVDELSFDSYHFRNVDGTTSEAISVSTYIVPKDYLRPFHNEPTLPTYFPVGTLDRLDIFVDRQHPFFTELGFTAEFAVASQVANFLQVMAGNSTNGRSALNLAHIVLKEAFGEEVSVTRDSVKQNVQKLFDNIVERVTELEWAQSLKDELTNDEKGEFLRRLQEAGQVAFFENFHNSGEFLRYVPRAVSRLFRLSPANWMSGVFGDELAHLHDFAPEVVDKSVERSRNVIQRALEECAEYLESPQADEFILRRVKTSALYLDGRLA